MELTPARSLPPQKIPPGRPRLRTAIPRMLGLLAAALITAGLVPSASAITDGQLDGEDHPYVGLVVVFDDAEGTVPLWRGSGTLISPKIFLTAGHVVGIDGFDGTVPMSARVYFETDVDGMVDDYPLSGGHAGTPLQHPDWNGLLTLPNTHDIGVVVLNEPVEMDQYGELPDIGTLDALATARGRQDVTFDVVGYGLQYIRRSPIKGPIHLDDDRIRHQGVVSLVNLGNSLSDGYNLMHNGDKGRDNGSGGTNFGDSGGPILLPGTNVVVAITSFGFNYQGTGPGFGFRTDTEVSQEFLNDVFNEYDPENNPFAQ
jgi:hypothetical protein